MITLCVPDVHEEVESFDYVLNKYKHVDRMVFSGDYFDSHKTRVGDLKPAGEIARRLKHMIDDPKKTFILGNHDASFGAFGWRVMYVSFSR